MTNDQRKTVPPLKRKRPDEGPLTIQTMAKRRKPTFLSVLLVLGLVVGFVSMALWVGGVFNGGSVFNRPTASPTATVTMISSKTHTQTASLVPTATITCTASATLTATPTETSTPTEVLMPFIIKGSVQYLQSSMLFQGYGCETLFIGGQVWDLQGTPVKNLVIVLSGDYGGELVELTSTSGEVGAYGESGYGFVLSNKTIDSNGVYIQLFDAGGDALSNLIQIPISASCLENLVLVNFQQVR